MTEMAEQFIPQNSGENEALLPIDIADAILFVLSAPQRVNVS
jgi:NADP-dependent 3-hydroxy acid dehydrogenase YdfG